MPAHAIISRLVLIAALLGPVVCGARAQDPQDPQPAGPPPAETTRDDAPPVASIADRIAALTAQIAAIDEAPEGRVEESEALRAALDLLTQASDQDRALLDLRARADAAAGQVIAARTEADALNAIDKTNPLARLDPPLAPEPTIEDLDTRVSTAATRRDAEDQQVQHFTDRLAQQDARRGAIAPEIAQRTQRLQELQDSDAATPAEDVPAPLAAARRELVEAEREFLPRRIATLEFEATSLDARIAALRARRDTARARVAEAERVVAALQARLDGRRTEITEGQRRAAEEVERRLANEHELVRTAASANTDRAKELERVAQQVGAANEARAQINRARLDVQQAYDEAVAEVDRLGLTEVYGRWMRLQRDRLPSVRSLRQALAATDAQLRNAQSKIFEFQGLEAGDPESDAEARIAAFERASGATMASAVRQRVSTALVTTLTAKDETTAGLVKEYQRLIDPALVQLQSEQLAYAELVAEYTAFIDERILWIQSTGPLHRTKLADHVAGIQWLTHPESWRQALAALRADWQRAPLPLTLGGIAVAVLLGMRRRLRRGLEQLAGLASNPLRGHFGHTAAAVGVSLLLAAPLPLLLALVAWRTASGAAGEEFPNVVAMGLASAATSLAVMLLMLTVARPHGLGSAHFGWPDHAMKLIRRYGRIVLPIVVVLIAIVTMLRLAPSRLHDSLGRVALILNFVGSSAILGLLLHPARGIPRDALARNPHGWLHRLRFIWYGGVVLLPVTFALMAAVGYLYTAEQLALNVRRTVWIGALVFAGHSLLVRALADAQRRLAIEQWRRRRAETEVKSETGESPTLPDEAVDITAVSEQARRLLLMLTTVVLLAAVALVWADALPAFRALEKVEVWDIRAPGGATGADGMPLTVPVTLWNIMLAIIVLCVTTLITRNVPGLLEITVLRRLPISAAGRYATTTVCRYAIVTIGVILAFGAIRIGWTHVQFLAAAITVGLGFGLQEIFANFVSGLILLFEQPIRVGDTVTIGNVSGTVSRIKMRATTIVDWDRKELVVPNKEFVTGQIINWTLTDGTLRVIIKVGVAYGSDTNLTRKTLLECAAANATVLQDPPPQALFLGFGDSALDFELRTFLPSMEHFMETRHELHMAIDAACRERGIEIAFPQRDLHLRTAMPIPVEVCAQDPTD